MIIMLPGLIQETQPSCQIDVQFLLTYLIAVESDKRDLNRVDSAERLPSTNSASERQDGE